MCRGTTRGVLQRGERAGGELKPSGPSTACSRRRAVDVALFPHPRAQSGKWCWQMILRRQHFAQRLTDLRRTQANWADALAVAAAGARESAFGQDLKIKCLAFQQGTGSRDIAAPGLT